MSEGENTKLDIQSSDWYAMLSLNGEQPLNNVDTELLNENRTIWNRIIKHYFPNETISISTAQPADLQNLSSTDISAIRKKFTRRGGKTFPLDGGDFDINIDSLSIDRIFNISGYIFPNCFCISKCTFGNDVILDDAIFLKDLHINESKFSKTTSFKAVKIGGKMTIKKSEFEIDASFEGIRCISDTHIEMNTFNGGSNFEKSRFFGEITFRNTEFRGLTNFNNTEFKMHVPDFRGSKLHEATLFHAAEWPEPPRARSGERNKAYEQIDRYSRLKQEMDRLKKSEDKLFFHRKELRSRQGLFAKTSSKVPGKGFTYYFVNRTYELLGNYGDSIFRPAAIFSAIWTLSSVIYFFGYIFPKDDKVGLLSRAFASVRLSFAGMLPYLPVKPKSIDPRIVDAQSAWVPILLNFQSISGAILIFLMILALRNRFGIR